MKAAQYRRWTASVTAYLFGGLVSSCAVGAGLGSLGALLPIVESDKALLGGTLVAVILAARELGVVHFDIPERTVQTRPLWAKRLGVVQGAALWGLHLGLGFATRISHGGFWAVVATICFARSPSFGAFLMGAYWIGRVLPVIVAGVAVASGAREANFGMPRAVVATDRTLRQIQAIGLLWWAFVTLMVATQVPV